MSKSSPTLSRKLGLIQRNVPGIGPYVLPAFLLAAIPALLAAFAYASLSSAMPRAGGSYIFASRGLHPYLGFVASFAQWFGLTIIIGVICSRYSGGIRLVHPRYYFRNRLGQGEFSLVTALDFCGYQYERTTIL